MGKVRGLGRGLDALIPVVSEAGEELRELEVDKIRANARQAREVWDEEALRELAASIQEHGLLQPVVVRPAGDGYELVAGERRWRACRMLGWRKISAIVRNYDDEQTAVALLVENLQRAELSPVEEAAAYRRLIEEFGLTQEEIARRVGKSRTAVGNTLRLLSLPAGVLALLRRGELSAGHARALLGCRDTGRMEALARRVVAQGLSVRQVEELVRREAEAPGGSERQREQGEGGEAMAAAAASLGKAVGAKVSVRALRKGWRLEMLFREQKDLERFIKRVCGEEVSRET